MLLFINSSAIRIACAFSSTLGSEEGHFALAPSDCRMHSRNFLPEKNIYRWKQFEDRVRVRVRVRDFACARNVKKCKLHRGEKMSLGSLGKHMLINSRIRTRMSQ